MPISFAATLREAAKDVKAHRATSAILILVTMAMTTVTFATAGQAAAVERDVLKSVEATGARLIIVNISEPSPGLDAAAVLRIQGIRDVQWVMGLGAARDVASTVEGLRTNVAARELATELPTDVHLLVGRKPMPGEVIVGSEAESNLQIVDPAGPILDGRATLPIVGSFEGGGQLGDFDRLALIGTNRENRPASTLLYVVAGSASSVEAVVDQIFALAGVRERENLQIETSSELARLGLVVSGQVGALGRQLALVAVGTGMALVGLTMSLATNTRKKDMGRRRALGASRSAVLVLSLLAGVIPTVLGAGLGTFVGISILTFVYEIPPPLSFVAATFTLIILAGATASIPAAAVAAWKDPVRVLRVP